MGILHGAHTHASGSGGNWTGTGLVTVSRVDATGVRA
jgi:hypothetical protein